MGTNKFALDEVRKFRFLELIFWYVTDFTFADIPVEEQGVVA
jgi:hypothetical protein